MSRTLGDFDYFLSKVLRSESIRNLQSLNLEEIFEPSKSFLP